MKWFKHSGSSLRTAAIERLIMEFGIAGYGLYFACVEMIAGSLSPENVTFELEHDAELLAHKFKMDTLQVERIMHRCIELGLFELADSGHITCMKLAILVDDYFSRSPEIRAIAASPAFLEAKTCGDIRKSDKPRTKSDQIRLDEIRLEEKEEDILSGTSTHHDHIPYAEIVNHLNKTCLCSFKPQTKQTRNLIKARWNDGYRLSDFKMVIDHKAERWLTDPKMCDYLRPVTLFGPKFESYLNEIPVEIREEESRGSA